MNEEPKNIWKKSFTGRPAMVIWLAVAIFTIMLGSFIGALVNYKKSMSDLLLGAGIVAGICLAACLLLTYVVWPLLRLLFWKHWRRTLFGFACFFTLIALFYAEEDWRGWHAWQKFKHTWEAKGESFDRASVIPPTVPDDQNFAMTPIVASCYSYILDKNGHQIKPQLTNVVNRLQMITIDYSYGNEPTNGTGNWQKSTVSDLKAWQQYYRTLAAKTNEFPVSVQPQSPAADVLLALSRYDSAIEELRQASQMPYSRFPLEYDKESPAAILLPHLAVMKRCSQVLQLRAIAELQNGQSDEALADVKLMLRLTDSIHTEPFLISHLVRIASVNLALQPVWEGLAEHKWSDAQLVELEQELAKLDFLSAYKLAVRGELVLCQIGNIEYLRRHPEQFPNLESGESSSSPPLSMRILCHLIPSGWFYQNQLRCALIMLEKCLPALDVKQGLVLPTTTRGADAAVDAEIVGHPNPYNFLERKLLPSLGAAVKRFAHGQESADLARVACALERYRLAHGEYPETLDALAPQFIAKLPHDIIGGQPLHYRRIASSQFVLYSIGWNETDNDGEVGLNESGVVDRNTGDWVWRYPAK